MGETVVTPILLNIVFWNIVVEYIDKMFLTSLLQ